MFGSYPMPVDMMQLPGGGWDPAAAFNPMMMNGMPLGGVGMDMMNAPPSFMMGGGPSYLMP